MGHFRFTAKSGSICFVSCSHLASRAERSQAKVDSSSKAMADCVGLAPFLQIDVRLIRGTSDTLSRRHTIRFSDQWHTQPSFLKTLAVLPSLLKIKSGNMGVKLETMRTAGEDKLAFWCRQLFRLNAMHRRAKNAKRPEKSLSIVWGGQDPKLNVGAQVQSVTVF